MRMLVLDARAAGAHKVADLLAATAASLGLGDAVAYLVDLQQTVLVPFVASGAERNHQIVPLAVESTVAGRVFQHSQFLTQPAVPGGGTRVWLPLFDGSERLGVLAVTLPDEKALYAEDGLLHARLLAFAALCTQLLMIKTLYGDTIVTLRRTAQMGLAAEIQWALLPPLTFTSDTVELAGALEPAYEVAGDSLDYAVDRGSVQMAVFDGMGHGLHSSQLAAMAVAAYRNSRRAGRSLVETLRGIDDAVQTVFAGVAFTTAILAHLDTESGRFRWVNAGHPPPLLLRNGRLIKELSVDPTVPLGLGNDVVREGGDQVVVGAEQLEPGDYVLLYTDGITEARSPVGEFFGDARLVDLVTRNLASGLAGAETMRRVIRELLDHQQGQLTDDATLLLVQWRRPSHRVG